MSTLFDVVALRNDGLQHRSRLGGQTLCGVRTRYQASRPELDRCPDCEKLAKVLEPPAKPQPKKHPDSAVKVTQGPESALPKPRSQKKELSPQLRALAERLGRDPKELAESIPADTLKRLKAPVLEHVTEDGRRVFRHDLMIRHGVRATRSS